MQANGVQEYKFEQERFIGKMEAVQKNIAFESSGVLQRLEKTIFIALTSTLVLGHLYMIFWGIELLTIPGIIWILRLAASVLAIHLGKLWKKKIIIILFTFLVYLFIRTRNVAGSSVFLPESSGKLLSGLWMCTACLGLGYILDEKELKRFLSAAAAVWTIGMMVYAGIGLYAAWTDRVVDGPGVGAWWNQYGHFARYDLIYVSTTSGNILSIAAMIALLGLICTKNRFGKVFYLVALIQLILMLSLTISRTAEMAVAAGIGATGGIISFTWLKKKNGNRIWLNRAVSIVLVVAVMIAALVCVMKLPDLFNHFKQSGSLLVNRAFAEVEEIGKTVSVSRGIFTDGKIELSGREELWLGVLSYLKQNPRMLLFGKSICSPLSNMGELSYYAHCHNALLQVLLESGLVGLSMILCLMVITVVRAFRIISCIRNPLWLKLLPALVASVWVGDLAECFSCFGSSQIPIGAFMFAAMGIICAFGENKRSRIIRGA